MLNSFQHPSGRMPDAGPGSDRSAAKRATCASPPLAGLAAKWTLNQVQGDENSAVTAELLQQ